MKRSKDATASKWLVLVYQLPARPANLRVKIWRRLQQLGAVALRNSVYVLPNSSEGLEDFSWLRAEIADLGGSASVMAAHVVDAFSDDELVDRFRQERTTDYRNLIKDAQDLLRRWRAQRRRSLGPGARRDAQAFRERYQRIRALDFFGSPDAVLAAEAVSQIEASLGASGPSTLPGSGSAAEQFRGKVWVTRARPGIDRVASAWLIRKYVDSSARFTFVHADTPALPGQIPFDMPRVEFGHHGTNCTMETLVDRFALADPAIRRLSQVVHDLDLKDNKYRHPESVAVGRIVEGLRQAFEKDDDLLSHGMVVMDALFRSFSAEVAPSPASPRQRSKAQFT